jgi:hypothetical protein
VQTFKRYLMIQGMMFVFGIVGPIFLIVYFLSQPDPALKWMYWWGLVITFADVLIALRLAKASDAKVKIDHRRPTDSVVICWSG